jgi:2-oxoglutarate ferredoxin oxidoreductase subunit delta
VTQAQKKESDKKPKTKGQVFIDIERCKGCGFCIEFCPSSVLVSDDGYNSKGYHPPVVDQPDACSGCDLCGLYCPDFAIYGVRFQTKLKNSKEKKNAG